MSAVLDAALADARTVIAAGGWISWALVGISVMLWTIVVLRALELRRGVRGPLRDALLTSPTAAPRGVIDRFVQRAAAALARPGGCHHDLDRWTMHEIDRTESFGAVLNALVAAAPLLGLLGTVAGMIETFASMHGSHHHSDESVAGGISIALVTTQLGLAIGIPGLIAARLLDRLAARRRRELQATRALLAARFDEGRAS
ncbi:MAG: MotA/TolQ/ExbB proton channel family protein [Deltaproteobacteria bacterium]|nr:MotA/TolQ/ExbB proton channel family protein [Deltaproteobacteria bacterium]